MNIQGSDMRKPRNAKRVHGLSRFKWLVPAGLLLAAVAGVADLYIYLNQGIARADKEMRQIRMELAVVEREMASCNLQYERYSAWPYVREAIGRFHLPLSQVTPDQCRRLAMIPPSIAPSIAIRFGKSSSGVAPAAQRKATPVRTVQNRTAAVSPKPFRQSAGSNKRIPRYSSRPVRNSAARNFGRTGFQRYVRN